MNKQTTTASKDKKSYTPPQIHVFGRVDQLTLTGLSNPGNDAKSGSVASQGR